MAFYEENPGGITSADVVVGIPSANEVESIARTTEQVDKGLTRYFPDLKCAIVNSDNHSATARGKLFSPHRQIRRGSTFQLNLALAAKGEIFEIFSKKLVSSTLKP